MQAGPVFHLLGVCANLENLHLVVKKGRSCPSLALALLPHGLGKPITTLAQILQGRGTASPRFPACSLE